MAWTWRYLDSQGSALPDTPDLHGAGGEFPNQSDAESWLGEHWRELAAAGVESVTLLDAGREVYGPMGLNPPD